MVVVSSLGGGGRVLQVSRTRERRAGRGYTGNRADGRGGRGKAAPGTSATACNERDRMEINVNATEPLLLKFIIPIIPP